MNGLPQNGLNRASGDKRNGINLKDKLLNSREAAEFLEISEEEVSDLVAEGTIPAYKIGGEFLRFRKQQLEALRENASLVRDNRSNVTSGSDFSNRVKMVKQHRVPIEKIIPVEDIKGRNKYSIWDTLRDFFCLNDFYILSAVLILLSIFVMLNKK